MDSQSQEVGSLVLKFMDISRVKGKMWNVYQKGKDFGGTWAAPVVPDGFRSFLPLGSASPPPQVISSCSLLCVRLH